MIRDYSAGRLPEEQSEIRLESREGKSYHNPQKSETVSSTMIPNAKGASKSIFPVRLHNMLTEIHSTWKVTPVIHWSEEGDELIIQDVEVFTNTLLPKYFRTKKFPSFARQLNAYGFSKINKRGYKKGVMCFTHELFHRDYPDRLFKMSRRGSGIKLSKIKQPTEKAVEMQLSFNPLFRNSHVSSDCMNSSVHGSLMFEVQSESIPSSIETNLNLQDDVTFQKSSKTLLQSMYNQFEDRVSETSPVRKYSPLDWNVKRESAVHDDDDEDDEFYRQVEWILHHTTYDLNDSTKGASQNTLHCEEYSLSDWDVERETLSV